MAAETESRFTSVERISHYIRSVPTEAPAEIVETKPQAEWPIEGIVKFDNLQVGFII